MVWGSLITAMTRATLNAAAAIDPASVLMIATDAIFTTRPLDQLTEGKGLGQWEASAHERLFIVMPGIYWGAKKPKTRGVSPSFFEDKTELFEAAFAGFARWDRRPFAAQVVRPSVGLPVKLFIGTKLAHARGKLGTACKWVSDVRTFSFDWSRKRGGYTWEGDHVWTYPPAGGPTVKSWVHLENKRLIEDLDLDKAELDDQPDYFALIPPWKED
jgi:hypothetical protein